MRAPSDALLLGLLLLYALCGACHRVAVTANAPRFPCAYDVVLDDTITVDDTIALYRGIADWSARVPVTLRVIRRPCHGHAPGVICVHRIDPESMRALSVGNRAQGLTTWDENGNGSEIWLQPETLSTDLQRRVATHELGHAMGLSHTTTGIMSRASSAPGVEAIDVQQWYEKRGLRWPIR